MEDKDSKNRSGSCCSCSRTKNLVILFLILIILSAVTMLGFITDSLNKQNVITTKMLSKLGGTNYPSSAGTSGLTGGNSFGSTDCDSTSMKLSFPDIDYALHGYNIMKGYPESEGHDPGFSFPIFKADYSTQQTTADCRYRIPAGIIAIPDVSCVTSFSSKIIKTSYEYEHYLSLFVKFKREFFGGSKLSASLRYQSFISFLLNNEYIYIMSSAHCGYYYVKLNDRKFPEFSSDFIDWIHRLDGSCNDELYYEFLDHFGTHFPIEVTFGAKYTIEHKMKTTAYNVFLRQNIDVAFLAKLSALVASFEVQVNLESSVSRNISFFQNSVTTTSKSIGAPPPSDGNAVNWASEVKENPLPVKYSLRPITELFTETHMSHLGVNYHLLKNRIEYFGQKYCSHLLNTAEVGNCDALYSGLDLTATRMHDHTRSISSVSLSECLKECLNHVACEAISYCIECIYGDSYYEKCYMYSEKDTEHAGASKDVKWTSFIFNSKIKTQLILDNVIVIGINREVNSGRANALEDCKNRCLNTNCVAYTYCNCAYKTENCMLYSESKIIGLKHQTGYTMSFLPRVDSILDESVTKCTNLNG